MWLAHYFPGLRIGLAELNALTPEQTGALHKAGRAVLDHEEKIRVAHTKAIMKSRVL